MPDPKIFFWIDVSLADAVAINHNGTKTFLANDMSTFSINGKRTDLNGIRNSRKRTFCLLIFLLVTLNEIPLFSKDLITLWYLLSHYSLVLVLNL